MNVLLDHQLPQKLETPLTTHNFKVTRAEQAELSAVGNGLVLTRAAAAGFQLFLTHDLNIKAEQNLQTLPITILELPWQEWGPLEPLVPSIQQAMLTVAYRINKNPGNRYYRVTKDGALVGPITKPGEKRGHWLLQKEAINVSEWGRQYMEMAQEEIVAEQTIGDYEIFLTHNRMFDIYQIGMQRIGSDAWDMSQQMDRTPGGIGRGSFGDFTKTIDSWISKYGELAFASMNPQKTRMYVMMAKHLGYEVRTENVLGQAIPFINGKSNRKTASVTQERMEEAAAAYEDMWEGEAEGFPNGVHPAHVRAAELYWKVEPSFALNRLEGIQDRAFWKRMRSEMPERAAEGSSKEEAQTYLNEFQAAIADGSIEPVIVAQGTDGKFYLWDGNHRVGEAEGAGVTSLPAWVGYQGQDKAKTAYMSPKQAELTVTIAHGARERVTVSLDLGIPNFTCFSIEVPVTGLVPEEIAEYAEQAVDALLDYVTAFLLSLKYPEQEILALVQAAVECYRSMNADNASDSKMSDQDDTIRMYEGRFDLPEEFVSATHQRIVTASVVRRLPEKREIKLEPVNLPEDDDDPGAVIQFFRDQSTRNTPRPFRLEVIKQRGKSGPARDWEERLTRRIAAPKQSRLLRPTA